MAAQGLNSGRYGGRAISRFDRLGYRRSWVGSPTPWRSRWMLVWPFSSPTSGQRAGHVGHPVAHRLASVHRPARHVPEIVRARLRHPLGRTGGRDARQRCHSGRLPSLHSLRATASRADRALPDPPAAHRDLHRRRGGQRRQDPPPVRQEGTPRLPGLRDPGQELLAGSVRSMSPRSGGRLLLQAQGVLSVLRRAAHGRDGRQPHRSRDPGGPVRQWVLSLPHRIRYRLAYDHEACTVALRAFIRTIFTDLRRRAKRRHHVVNGKPGGITVIQRFASSLALNVHFHSLLLDGVYTLREDGTVRFVPLPPPTDEEIVALTKKVGRSMRRALERAGKLLDDLDPNPDALAVDDPARAALYGASIAGRVAMGPRAGRAVEREGDRVTVDDAEQLTSRRCARVQGFSRGYRASRCTPTSQSPPVIASGSSGCCDTSLDHRWQPSASIGDPMASCCICFASRGATARGVWCSHRPSSSRSSSHWSRRRRRTCCGITAC